MRHVEDYYDDDDVDDGSEKETGDRIITTSVQLKQTCTEV